MACAKLSNAPGRAGDERPPDEAGGSLRDVQLLAGHAIVTTQRYIDGDSDSQRRLISLI